MLKLFEYANSNIVVAIVGPAILGIAATGFKLFIDFTNRIQELDNRLTHLSVEYEGRLSQYSEWLIYLTEDKEAIKPSFLECVDASLLRRSIKEFAAKPTLAAVTQYQSNYKCEEGFKFNPVFADLSEHSTLSIVSEMRVISQELEQHNKDHKSVVKVVGCEHMYISLTERLTLATNALLHPDAVIPFTFTTHIIDSQDGLTDVEKLRSPFMCNFYGIGPESLWYTDIPWG